MLTSLFYARNSRMASHAGSPQEGLEVGDKGDNAEGWWVTSSALSGWNGGRGRDQCGGVVDGRS